MDDDGNLVIDDAAPIPPFEPGNGDDVSLDHPLFPHWPIAWPLPNPNNAVPPNAIAPNVPSAIMLSFL